MQKRELNLSELFSIVISMEQDEAVDRITAIIEDNINQEDTERIIDMSERRNDDSSSRSNAVKTILNLITNQSTEK